MFLNLLEGLKKAGLPVSITEYLALIEAVEAGVAGYSVEDFYFLSRATLVKDERNLDRFDRVFGQIFKDLEGSASLEGILAHIPEDWLKNLTDRLFSAEDKAKIEALGGWDKLMETLRERLPSRRNAIRAGPNGSAPAARHPLAPMATIPKACASASMRAATGAP
jgi:uncharacterized protein with von Willebrand factor type A (vWA) domain